MAINTVLFILVSVLAISCNSGGGSGEALPAPWIGSCDTITSGATGQTGLCRTWRGQENGDFATHCRDDLGGTYTASQASCSEANLVGTCQTDQGFDLYLTYYYYSNNFNESSAQTHCESLSSCTFSCVFDGP